MSIQGYKSLVKAESSQVAFTDEVTTTSDNQNYQITDANKRIIAYESTPTVKDGGTTTVEEYTISKLSGTITFDSVDAGRVITISGSYVVLSTVAEANKWSINSKLTMLNSTVFSKTSKEFKPGLLNATATIGKFYDITNYFIEAIKNKTVFIVEFYTDASNDPYRFFAIVAGDGVSTSIDVLIDESVNLQITDKMITEV